METKMTIKEFCCPLCDRKTNIILLKEDFNSVFKHKPISLKNIERYKCTSCDEEFFTNEQIEQLNKKIMEL